MATYNELFTLANDPTLIKKVTIAIAILAESIRLEEPPITARRMWAVRALNNPDGEARKIMWLLMAQNKDATVAQIEGAPDATIQTAVANAIDLLTNIY